MPKMKTHKATAKRIRLTANKKIVHRHPNVRHFMAGRSPKTKRQSGCTGTMTTAGYVKRVINQLPYDH